MKLSRRILSIAPGFYPKQATPFVPSSQQSFHSRDCIEASAFSTKNVLDKTADETRVFYIYRHNLRLRLEILTNPAEKSDSERAQSLHVIRDITTQARADFGDVVHHRVNGFNCFIVGCDTEGKATSPIILKD